MALAAAQKMGRKSLRKWIRARQRSSEPAEWWWNEGSGQQSVESCLFWEGLGETIDRVRKWGAKGRRRIQRCRREVTKKKSYLKLVGRSHQFIQVRENCRCSICSENSETKLLLVLNRKKLQFLEETKCYCFTKGFLNLIWDSETLFASQCSWIF